VSVLSSRGAVSQHGLRLRAAHHVAYEVVACGEIGNVHGGERPGIHKRVRPRATHRAPAAGRSTHTIGANHPVAEGRGVLEVPQMESGSITVATLPSSRLNCGWAP